MSKNVRQTRTVAVRKQARGFRANEVIYLDFKWCGQPGPYLVDSIVSYNDPFGAPVVSIIAKPLFGRLHGDDGSYQPWTIPLKPFPVEVDPTHQLLRLAGPPVTYIIEEPL